MASALLELRKAAGFKKSAEFAKVVKIPASTYARYESSPDKIPMGAARQLADWFRVPIDVIVGREEVDVRALRGDVQEEYDSLSEESKLALDQFLAFLVQKDATERRRRQDDEDRRFEALAWNYERQYLQGLDEDADFGDLMAFGTAEQQRAGFERFVREKAAKRRGKLSTKAQELTDEKTIEKIMDAYDRIHETYLVGGGAVFCSSMDMRNPHLVSVEYDSDGRRGGGARRP